MNLTDHTMLSLRMEMQQRGWVKRLAMDDPSHDWRSTPHWQCTDLTDAILRGYQVGGLTQLDLHPLVVGDDDGNFCDDVYASCFVRADGSLTHWCLAECFAGTSADFNAHKASLDDLSTILTAWLKSMEQG